MEFEVLSAAVGNHDVHFSCAEAMIAIRAIHQRGLIQFEGAPNRFIGTTLGALAYRLELAIRRGTPTP
jgi:hypothetical protein